MAKISSDGISDIFVFRTHTLGVFHNSNNLCGTSLVASSMMILLMAYYSFTPGRTILILPQFPS
ncbi:MAG: hypothetical protein O8C55_03945 [Candidatus Methanoperedens sp.]|nr:hypothetical protein [Candidatus Methanoperedens sp.]